MLERPVRRVRSTRISQRTDRTATGRFAAIDFETANSHPDSACAVAIAVVDGLEIVAQRSVLLRPPTRHFTFTHVHGIRWKDVANQPTFAEAWPELEHCLEGVEFLAAHWANFDQSVLHGCCAAAGLSPPALPFFCTVELARRVWRIYPTRLPDVCRRLCIPLEHHRASSDAAACARIVIAARREGFV